MGGSRGDDDQLFGERSADVEQVLIDLSVTVSERLPGVWPDHHPFEREVTRTHPPYFTEALWIDEHTGTHFDAPAHFLPGTAESPTTFGDRVDLRL